MTEAGTSEKPQKVEWKFVVDARDTQIEYSYKQFLNGINHQYISATASANIRRIDIDMILPKILCVIVLIFTVSASENEARKCQREEITPKDKCEVCECIDGNSICIRNNTCEDEIKMPPGVLLQRLEPRQRRQAECTRGQTKTVECNQCRCIRGGVWACTRKACVAPPNQQHKRETFSCTPGQTFRKDCNTCRCTPDGINAICTLKACFMHGDELP